MFRAVNFFAQKLFSIKHNGSFVSGGQFLLQSLKHEQTAFGALKPIPSGGSPSAGQFLLRKIEHPEVNLECDKPKIDRPNGIGFGRSVFFAQRFKMTGV